MKRVLIISLLVSAQAFAGLECLTRKVQVIKRDLPSELEAGVLNVFIDPAKIITIFSPLPPQKKGKLIDIHSVDSKLPSRFVIGNGNLGYAFIGVDQRPGTRLALCVEELANEFSNNGRSTSEATLQAIRTGISDYLDLVPDEDIIPWDEPFADPGNVQKYLDAAAKKTVKDSPLPTGRKLAVIPLEHFLQYGQGYCLQKNLITALVLQHLKVKFRMVFGGSDMVGSGHNWTKLADGRYLDTTWQILAKPTTEGALPGWFRHGTSFMFINQRYPFVDLTQ